MTAITIEKKKPQDKLLIPSYKEGLQELREYCTDVGLTLKGGKHNVTIIAHSTDDIRNITDIVYNFGFSLKLS